MSDFFEIPRAKPVVPVETLEIKALGLETAKNSEKLGETLENPKEIICFSENDEQFPEKTRENDEKLSENSEKSPKNANFFSNLEDERETHHESLRNEPVKRTLEIIEENLEKIKKEAENSRFSQEFPGKSAKIHGNSQKNKPISKKIQNIIDFGEAELGEVGEWVEKTANCERNSENSREDSDFDDVFTESHRENQGKVVSSERNSKKNAGNVAKIEKFGLGGDKKSTGKGGYMVNNLKDKAKSMQLAQGVMTETKTNEKNGENVNENANTNSEDNRNFHESNRKMIGIQEEEKNFIAEREPEHFNNNDWDEISRRNLEHLNQSNIRIHTEEDGLPVSFQEIWSLTKSLDLSKEKRNIIPFSSENLSFFERLFFSCTTTKLPASLLTERDQVFAFAKVPYDDKNPLHFRMISTIYKKLTNATHCVRYGEHWEKIGFQGRDPATDLRGVGMLGVLQILAFLDLNFPLLKNVYEHSLNEIYHFPLAVGLLNMTEIMLQTLREGKLNHVILRQKSVMNACNAYYFAVFFMFFNIYKDNHMVESQFGELKKKVAEIAKKKPAKLIADFLKNKEVFCKLN